MQKKIFASVLATAAVALLSMGCTPEARQDLGQAGDKIGSATEKSAQGTAEAVDKAGEKVAEGTKEAARMTGEAVGGVVKKTGQAAEQVGAAATITPKVKGALVADKSVDASTLNVTTDEKTKTVIIEGTLPSQANKNQATAIAKKALADGHWDYKVQNNVKIP
jgi:hypothetical protein